MAKRKNNLKADKSWQSTKMRTRSQMAGKSRPGSATVGSHLMVEEEPQRIPPDNHDQMDTAISYDRSSTHGEAMDISSDIVVPFTLANEGIHTNASRTRSARAARRRLWQGTTSKCCRGKYKGINMDKLTNGWKQKAMVSFGPAGNVCPVDQYATQLRSFLGNLIKVTTKAPIYAWHDIMQQYEQHLWTIITDKFEVSNASPIKFQRLEEREGLEPDTPEMKQQKFRSFCFKYMRENYRKWKSDIYIDRYKEFESDEERRANPPEGMPDELWVKLCNIYASDRYQRRSKLYSMNRAKHVVKASTGPTPFVEVEYRLMKEDTGELPKVSDLWRETHESHQKAGSWNDPASLTIYVKLKDVEDSQVAKGEKPLHRDEVSRRVFGSRPGYLVGRGNGYKPQSQYCGSTSPVQQEELEVLQGTVALQQQMIEEQGNELTNTRKELAETRKRLTEQLFKMQMMLERLYEKQIRD